MQKFLDDRPYASPKAAGQRLWHHAREATKPLQHPDWVYVELVNGPFLFKDGGSPAEYTAGMNWLIQEGCIALHDSGCYFIMHPKGHDLFGTLAA